VATHSLPTLPENPGGEAMIKINSKNRIGKKATSVEMDQKLIQE